MLKMFEQSLMSKMLKWSNMLKQSKHHNLKTVKKILTGQKSPKSPKGQQFLYIYLCFALVLIITHARRFSDCGIFPGPIQYLSCDVCRSVYAIVYYMLV